MHEGNENMSCSSVGQNLTCNLIIKYIIGPTVLNDNNIRSQTDNVNGANNPELVADSGGLFINTTHCPISKLLEYRT